jgi:Icc-related predicted phosphoesterase
MSLNYEKNEDSEFVHYTDALDREISLIRTNGTLTGIVSSFFRPLFVPQKDSLRFGIIGDTHGHMTDALTKLDEWVEFSGLPLDALLQVGDIGAFDDTSVLDRVTREMAEKDSEELGFKKYLQGSPEADKFFGKNGAFEKINLYFVEGNHDDINYVLQNYNEQTLQIGAYSNIRYIPENRVVNVSNDKQQVSIAGLGWNATKQYVNPAKEQVDIFLSHQVPKSVDTPYGDEEVAKHIESFPPTYHFFGHSHNRAVSLSDIPKNQYGLTNVQKSKGKLKPGSIGVLEITSEKEHQFLYLPEDSLRSF